MIYVFAVLWILYAIAVNRNPDTKDRDMSDF